MTQSFLWVDCFSKVAALPAPPVDRSGGDDEWARGDILISHTGQATLPLGCSCNVGSLRSKPSSLLTEED